MSKTIHGVPESVTREQYLSFFEAVGIDPKGVKSLRFLSDAIEAVVFEHDDEGRKVIAWDPSCVCPAGEPDAVFEESPDCTAQHGALKHTIVIPVKG